MEAGEAVNAFEQALGRLREVMAEPETAIIRDAAIKRFEFTFELAWKAIQRYARDEGITCRSPKGCLREAFALGIISDDPRWIRLIDDRNLTAHTYDEETAKTIFRNLKADYVLLFEQLRQGLVSRLGPS
jgi:nucleotidyltransferase substrate binding protein (TIGR01987 family)